MSEIYKLLVRGNLNEFIEILVTLSAYIIKMWRVGNPHKFTNIYSLRISEHNKVERINIRLDSKYMDSNIERTRTTKICNNDS